MQRVHRLQSQRKPRRSYIVRHNLTMEWWLQLRTLYGSNFGYWTANCRLFYSRRIHRTTTHYLVHSRLNLHLCSMHMCFSGSSEVKDLDARWNTKTTKMVVERCTNFPILGCELPGYSTCYARATLN